MDVYIKPYYSAENGKAENVFVHKEIDPMLRENTIKGYESAVKFVEENPARISPMTMFTLAARAYDFGLRDEARYLVLSWTKPFDHRTLCVRFTKTNGAG